jgi:hypothetical protein
MMRCRLGLKMIGESRLGYSTYGASHSQSHWRHREMMSLMKNYKILQLSLATAEDFFAESYREISRRAVSNLQLPR